MYGNWSELASFWIATKIFWNIPPTSPDNFPWRMSLHCLKLQNWTYLPESGALLCDLLTVSSREVIWRMAGGRCATIPAIIVGAERLQEWRTARVQGSSAAGLEPVSSVSSSRWDTFWTDVRGLAALHHNPRALNAGEQVGETAAWKRGELCLRGFESQRTEMALNFECRLLYGGQDTFQCWFVRGFGGKRRTCISYTCCVSVMSYLLAYTDYVWKTFGIIIESEQMSAGTHQSLFRQLGVNFVFRDSANSRCLSQMMGTALPKKQKKKSKRIEKQNLGCCNWLFGLPGGTFTCCVFWQRSDSWLIWRSNSDCLITSVKPIGFWWNNPCGSFVLVHLIEFIHAFCWKIRTHFFLPGSFVLSMRSNSSQQC